MVLFKIKKCLQENAIMLVVFQKSLNAPFVLHARGQRVWLCSVFFYVNKNKHGDSRAPLADLKELKKYRVHVVFIAHFQN